MTRSLMPSACAACPMLPRCSWRASVISCRSSCSSASGSVPRNEQSAQGACMAGGRRSGRIRPSVVRMTARSMTFSSSRMLPGHEWASSSASASGATRSPRLPILWPYFSRKFSTSRGMSPCRSRSGGIETGNTFSR